MPEPKCMTLEELIDKTGEAAHFLDDKAADILSRNPDLVKTHVNAKGETVGGYQLGRIIAIGIMDFLCWAFDRPELGYLPPNERGGQP